MFSGLSKNPMFAGGLGIAGLGVGAAMLRRGLLSGMLVAQKYYTVSLEVASKDRSYQWLLHWLARYTRNKTQHLSVETTITHMQGGQINAAFDFVPSTGNHWFWYKNRLINVRREREKQMVDLQSGSPWETVTLTSLGRDRSVFVSLLNEAREMATAKTAGKTLIYTAYGTDWRQFGQGRNKRPMHSVILPQGIAEGLHHDLVEFTRSQKWYVDRGIPYRRGYLLYGPPGCGKSSYIFALAGALNYNIALLNLNDKGLTDDRLNVLLSVVPPRTLLLLEDVDAAFSKAREAKNAYTVTFSGLLNALDGVASGEERVIFMTTNFLDRLDSALIRPGRVDVKIEVGYATKPQMRGMFLRFYPEGREEDVQAFLDRVEESQRHRQGAGQHSELSMAELQGYFLVHKHSMKMAIEHAINIHDTQTQMAVAAKAVNTFSVSKPDQPQQQPQRQSIVAVPDPPPDPKMIEAIQKRIAEEEAKAKAREQATGNTNDGMISPSTSSSSTSTNQR